MSAQIVPVILAGGQGTRLWPMSRSARPKQFLPLTGEIVAVPGDAAARRRSDRYAPAIVITNAEYRFLVAEQAQEIGAPLAGVLLEPMARNTMAAIAAAAFYARQTVWRRCGDSCARFRRRDRCRRQLLAIGRSRRGGRAQWLARDLWHHADGARDRLRLHRGRRRNLARASTPSRALSKSPTSPTPRACSRRAASTGTPACSCSASMLFLAEAQALSPESHATAQGQRSSKRKHRSRFHPARRRRVLPRRRTSRSTTRSSRSPSKVAMVPVTFAWSDLGAWDAVWKVSPHDAAGNVARGQGNSERHAQLAASCPTRPMSSSTASRMSPSSPPRMPSTSASSATHSMSAPSSRR